MSWSIWLRKLLGIDSRIFIREIKTYWKWRYQWEIFRAKWLGTVRMQLRIIYLRLRFISLESITLKIFRIDWFFAFHPLNISHLSRISCSFIWKHFLDFANRFQDGNFNHFRWILAVLVFFQNLMAIQSLLCFQILVLLILLRIYLRAIQQKNWEVLDKKFPIIQIFHHYHI